MLRYHCYFKNENTSNVKLLKVIQNIAERTTLWQTAKDSQEFSLRKLRENINYFT